MRKNMPAIFVIAVVFIAFVCIGRLVKESSQARGPKLSLSQERRYAAWDKSPVVLPSDNRRERAGAADINRSVEEQSGGQPEEAVFETKALSETVEDENTAVSESGTERGEYLIRLKGIEDYYEQLWNDAAGPLDIASMKELKNQEYTKWDNELNTIYQKIKSKLPEEEFIPIRDEERLWIKKRDEAASQAANKVAGGSLEGFEYLSVMTEMTRIRTYELVKIYFAE